MKKILFLSMATLCVTVSQAQIMSVSGSSVQVVPPASVVPNVTESDTDSIVFQETASTVLGADLIVDGTVPGTTYTAAGTFSILAGTNVASYFIHSDKVGATNTAVAYNGSVTFKQRILGVIGKADRLDSSDPILGLGSVTYGTGDNDRQWEYGAQEKYTISNDGFTIRFDNRLDISADQIRVITDAVPEPATMTLLGLGIAALAAKKRARKA